MGMASGNQRGRYIDITTETSNPVAFTNTYMSDCNAANKVYSVLLISCVSAPVNNQLITLQYRTDGNGNKIELFLGSGYGCRYRNNSFASYGYTTAYDTMASIGDKYYLVESDAITF